MCHKVFPCRALLLSAPSHEATQPPHRSRKPTEEEALTGQAPALIHQTRCKNQLSEPQPAPDPWNVCRFRVVAAENICHSSNATLFFPAVAHWTWWQARKSRGKRREISCGWEGNKYQKERKKNKTISGLEEKQNIWGEISTAVDSVGVRSWSAEITKRLSNVSPLVYFTSVNKLFFLRK